MPISYAHLIVHALTFALLALTVRRSGDLGMGRWKIAEQANDLVTGCRLHCTINWPLGNKSPEQRHTESRLESISIHPTTESLIECLVTRDPLVTCAVCSFAMLRRPRLYRFLPPKHVNCPSTVRSPRKQSFVRLIVRRSESLMELSTDNGSITLE